MLKAVIFDFDGVITDSEVLHFRAFNKVLAQFDFQISTPDYYKKYLGMTDKDCYQELITEGLISAQTDQIPALIAQKKKIYRILAETEGRIIEGVHPFLTMLHQNEITLGICSGALQAEIEYVLDQAKLREHFITVVAADHVNHGKPDPEGFCLALDQLHQFDPSINASNTLVIEDAHWGISAANAAGMRTIAVTNSYPAEQLNKADKIVDRLDALTIEEMHALCTS
jgi:beta-phosphoglucomutase